MWKNSAEQSADFFKVLGDKTRLTMLKLLKSRECCVCEFVEIFKMSQPAISQHVRRLKDLNLINERRSGQWIFYSLNNDSEHYDLLNGILGHIPSQDKTLAWLKQEMLTTTCD